jgi:hypothetical protein
MGHRRGVAELSRALACLVDKFAFASDFAQLPHDHGEDGHHNGSGVVVEPLLALPVVIRLAGLERSLAMGLRLEEIAAW